MIDNHVNQCQESSTLLERSISDCAALRKKHTADVLREWNRKKDLFMAALDNSQSSHITLGSIGLEFLEHGPIGECALMQRLLVYFASQNIFYLYVYAVLLQLCDGTVLNPFNLIFVVINSLGELNSRSSTPAW